MVQFTIKKNPVTDTPAYDSLSEQQRCELLARAMGRHYEPPDNMIEMSGDFAANPRPSDPNPFASANDYRALRLWADGKKCSLEIDNMKKDNMATWLMDTGDGMDSEFYSHNDYDAECHAIIKALGLVLGLWT